MFVWIVGDLEYHLIECGKRVISRKSPGACVCTPIKKLFLLVKHKVLWQLIYIHTHYHTYYMCLDFSMPGVLDRS